MATFDTLIDDLASRFGLGVNARALIEQALTMISTSPGGLSGLLDRFKAAGLSSEAASWLGHADAGPIGAAHIEQVLGAAALSGISGRLGLGQGVVSTALGYALPKIVGLLTPGGVVPAGVPAEITRFLSEPRTAAAEQVAPRRIDILPADGESRTSVARWLPTALGALAAVALLAYLWWAFNRTPSAPPVAQSPAPSTVAQAPPEAPRPAPPAPPPPPAAQPPAPPSTETQAAAPPPAPPAAPAEAHAPAAQPPSPPPAAQAPAPAPSPSTAEQTPATPVPPAVATAEPNPSASAATPPRLALSEEGGAVRASGVVGDDDAKRSIVDMLNAVFGADKVKSDISIDKSAAAAGWLGDLGRGLEALKGANVDAIFEGDKVNVGGAMDDNARDKIIAALKSALGAGVAVGALTDKTAAAVAVANDRATSELASLQSGFGVKDLLFALNDSVVNFESGSAEVPEAMGPFLKTAAADLKQLKAGHVLEIAGYTDNTGDAALNLSLSQKRAEAVREALIKYGVDPDMLVAKGYGDADPIASNDTADGRLKNRRIEYHVVKAPT